MPGRVANSELEVVEQLPTRCGSNTADRATPVAIVEWVLNDIISWEAHSRRAWNNEASSYEENGRVAHGFNNQGPADERTGRIPSSVCA